MSLGARIGRKEGLEPNLLQGYVLRSADRRDHREVAHLKTILGEMNRQYWEARRTKIGRPPPWRDSRQCQHLVQKRRRGGIRHSPIASRRTPWTSASPNCSQLDTNERIFLNMSLMTFGGCSPSAPSSSHANMESAAAFVSMTSQYRFMTTAG